MPAEVIEGTSARSNSAWLRPGSLASSANLVLSSGPARRVDRPQDRDAHPVLLDIDVEVHLFSPPCATSGIRTWSRPARPGWRRPPGSRACPRSGHAARGGSSRRGRPPAGACPHRLLEPLEGHEGIVLPDEEGDLPPLEEGGIGEELLGRPVEVGREGVGHRGGVARILGDPGLVVLVLGESLGRGIDRDAEEQAATLSPAVMRRAG